MTFELTKEEITKIKDYVKKYDSDKFTIQKNGMVSICGIMPNSNVYAWWNAGYVDEILILLEKEIKEE